MLKALVTHSAIVCGATFLFLPHFDGFTWDLHEYIFLIMTLICPLSYQFAELPQQRLLMNSTLLHQVLKTTCWNTPCPYHRVSTQPNMIHWCQISMSWEILTCQMCGVCRRELEMCVCDWYILLPLLYTTCK